MVPYECLSEEGDLARQAIVELLVVVHDLRSARARLLGGGIHFAREGRRVARFQGTVVRGGRALPRTPSAPSASRRTRARRLRVRRPEHPLQLDAEFLDVAARGSLLKYSSSLNPFVYALAAEAGYRHGNDGTGAGLAGLELDLILPIGRRSALGLTPMAWRVVFGGDRTGSELATRLFRFDYLLSDRLALTFDGPLEVNWKKPAAELALGVSLSYALRSVKLAGGSLIEHHDEKIERRDATWQPPAAPYGRLGGRAPSWYVATEAATVEPPAAAIKDHPYGAGSLGGAVSWDRDRWGGRFLWAPGASLSIGARSTSGESSYLTGAFGIGLRWYCLRVLGLSLTPVRIEGGPKIRGKEELDPSPDVHGSPGSQYYFQAGTRAGIALNTGIVDILVEAPTIAWRAKPFDTGEILSIHLGIRLN